MKASVEQTAISDQATGSNSAVSNSAVSDPTLAVLVPRRSPMRAVLAAVAIAVLLAAAWYVPTALRPRVADRGGSSWRILEDRRLVESAITLDSPWPGFTLLGVEEVPGATVVDAWLVPGTRLDPPTRGDDQRLPQRLAPGTTAVLVVQWRIDDCERLHSELLALRGRTVLGTSVSVGLSDIADLFHPGFDPEALAETGICPEAP